MATTSKPFAASISVRARRDGSPVFDVRYRHQGSSKRLSFNEQRGAEKWANILRQVGPEQALELLKLGTSDTTPTVDQYAETYMASKSGIEGKTLDQYRMYMRLHISPAFGQLPLDAVTPQTIANWINAQAAAGNAAKSIKNRHGFLSAMFQSAVEDGLITKNPCGRSKLPESERLEMVFLTPNDFAQLLSYIPADYEALVLTLALTGLRWGEATALRPTDVDLDALTIRVARAWKYSTEKSWYIGPPKTRRSRRTVSIPEVLTPYLQPLMKNEYLFLNKYGKPVRQAKFYESVWNPARRLANGLPAYDKPKSGSDVYIPRTGGVWAREPSADPIGKIPRVHDLRHSHASWLLADGIGIDVVSRRLGHESIKTSVDVYGHLTTERLHGPAKAIGRILSGSMPTLE